MLTFNQSVMSGDVPDLVRLKPKSKVLQDVIKGAAVAGAAALLGRRPEEGTMDPGTGEG
jgi:hypothetical protein